MEGENDEQVERKFNHDSENRRVSHSRKISSGMLILLFGISTVVSGVSVYAYDRYFAQKVAVIDIRGYLMERKNMFLKGSITEKQFTESVDKIDTALRKTDKRTVVLMGDAVVRNAEKITIEN